MKTQILVALTLAGCAAVSVGAAVRYWDINGATPGAGGPTPSGTWDTTTANWTTDSGGASPTTTWNDGDDAVFSAGADATGDFAITIDGAQTAGNVTVEEGNLVFGGGALNLGEGVAGKGVFQVASNLNAVLNVAWNGGDDQGVLTKTGAGTLTLGAESFSGATTVVAEGFLAITNPSALGNGLAPTVVSNGASLVLPVSMSCAESVILNGFGFSNRGALHGYVGTTGAGTSWTGGAIINSTARINHYGTSGSWWNWTTTVIVTNGVNNADLYFGGTGHTLRLNINIDYPNNPGYRRPCIDIGDGVLYKDGSMELRLENSNIAREVRFNEGHILARCGPGTNFCYRAVVPGFFYCAFGGLEGAFWSSGEYVPATIYVGPNAGEFRNGPNGPSQHWTHPIVLAEGANPVFRPRSFTGASIICGGVISGPGGISKFNDAGTLYLYTNNTYAGPTTIRGGPLTLGVNGSISNSVRIDVWTNGIFDVTAKAGGFVLQPAQTLQGHGTVQGNVIALGTLAPGSSIGTLTNAGNLTLAGTVLIELDKSGAPSNDQLHVTGSLSHSGGGAIQVVNLGPALAPGDSFQIFNQPVVNGQTMSVSGGGAIWTNKLAVDGSIAVLSVIPPVVPATNLTIQVSGPNARALGGQGAAHSAYHVYASTNVTLPMSNWWLIGVTNSDAGGLIQFVDTGATNAQRFYRFGQPSP